MTLRRIALLPLLLLATGCVHYLDQSALLQGARIPWEPAGRPAPTLELPVDGAVLKGHVKEVPGARVAVLYFGGNAEIVGPSSPVMDLARRHRFDAYALNYRDFGPSDGEASFQALLNDALAAYEMVSARAAGRGQKLVVYGFSLGSAAALHVATSRPVDGLILQAPPTSAREAVPELDRGLPFLVRTMVRLRPADDVVAWSPQPIDMAPRLSAPLLVLHGTTDRVIPFAMGQRLEKAAGSATKTFCPVENADHNDLWSVGGEAPHRCLDTFLAALR